MTVEMLYHNDWVSLKMIRDTEAGVGGYVYSHETRCQGRIVAVLPFRTADDGEREFLLKSEVTPCWGMEQVVSAITGGYEGGDIEDDAVREMLEETGYEITRDELISLGTCYASKSADTVYSLFTVDLTGREAGEAIGDGTRLESESKAVWLRGEDLIAIQDAQVSVMAYRVGLRSSMSRVITDEISYDFGEVARLLRSRQQAKEGDTTPWRDLEDDQ